MTLSANGLAPITVQQRGATALLQISVSRFDAAIADDMKARLKEAVPDGDGPVIIDLSLVEFIDSSGLGALVALRKYLPEHRSIRLSHPTPFVSRVLRLTCLDRIFDITG